MSQELFPPLPLTEWKDTRDTLNLYARLLGKIRGKLMPPQKHHWHVSLYTTAIGLTTGPMPAGSQTFDLTLDFKSHLAGIHTSKGDWQETILEGQPPSVFLKDTLAVLEGLDIEVPPFDSDIFASDRPLAYDDAQVEQYHQALSQVDMLMKQFKGEFRGETSPVQLWPHHFDVSLVWLTGGLIPDQDPDDPEWSDKQVSFGFSTGDDGIPEPYFYCGAYPWPTAITDQTLPAGAFWHTTSFKGAVLPYAAVVDAGDPRDLLLTYWRTVKRLAAPLL